jgi:prolyl oligopeptidase
MEQYFARSEDGTPVPYFLLRRKDTKPDGQNPTLLYGYGGFEISLLPNYSPVRARLWLEQGGVIAVANLRGGGEFGPKWHEAGMKAEKQNVFNDFFAVAEDMIARKITSPKKLAAQGGSNGGLLMGAAITPRPDLFGAINCNSPLLDMLRYTKLPPGASWISEYGDPDMPRDREIIEQYSPYQLVEKETNYPPVFFVTSTADDRVHPGHARKMAAKMLNMGHNVLFYENMEGGHAAAADNTQRAKMVSLEYLFLLNIKEISAI